MRSRLKLMVTLMILVTTFYGCSSSLINAARDGDLATTQKLIKEGAKLNERDFFDGESALIVASKNGKLDVVKALIQAGADVNLRSKYNDTALIAAAWKCHPDIIELLLNHGANPNAQNSYFKSTSLMLLADFCNDAKSVKALLLKGADAGATNRGGETALMSAARKGKTEIVTILLDHRANSDERGQLMQAALYVAAEQGHTETLDVLLAKGADPNVEVRGGCVSTGRRCDPVPGWTALMIATAEGHADAVDLLLKKGANPNLKNSHGRTALMFAAGYGFTRIVDSLLKKGADPNIIPFGKNSPPALVAAVMGNHKSIVEALLKNGANINIRTLEGKTALYWAKKYDYSELLKLLTDAGATE